VATNNTVERFEYSYDAKDRMTSVASMTDGQEDFGYDTRDQLTSSNRAGTVLDEAFTYDSSGNRDSKVKGSAGVQSSMYGNAYQQNRLQSDASYTYTYDKEGNLLTRKSLGTIPQFVNYVWDYRNRLTSVQYRRYDPNQSLPSGVTANPITKQGPFNRCQARMALSDLAGDAFLLAGSQALSDRLLKVALEEIAHYATNGATDNSRDLQDYVLEVASRLARREEFHSSDHGQREPAIIV